jgi:hypothetical protein
MLQIAALRLIDIFQAATISRGRELARDEASPDNTRLGGIPSNIKNAPILADGGVLFI